MHRSYGVESLVWGTLESGKSSGVLVFDVNPLDDIENTQRISAVYLRGAAVDLAKLP